MYQRILVPVDGSATSDRGLAEALKLARLTGAAIRLIHVLDDLSFAINPEEISLNAEDILPALRARGARILARAQAQAGEQGVDCDSVLREGHISRICDLVVAEAKAWPADLIVIGTHGRRGTERLFLGSDAEQILRVTPVPVLLVRAPGTAG